MCPRVFDRFNVAPDGIRNLNSLLSVGSTADRSRANSAQMTLTIQARFIVSRQNSQFSRLNYLPIRGTDCCPHRNSISSLLTKLTRNPSSCCLHCRHAMALSSTKCMSDPSDTHTNNIRNDKTDLLAPLQRESFFGFLPQTGRLEQTNSRLACGLLQCPLLSLS